MGYFRIGIDSSFSLFETATSLRKLIRKDNDDLYLPKTGIRTLGLPQHWKLVFSMYYKTTTYKTNYSKMVIAL